MAEFVVDGPLRRQRTSPQEGHGEARDAHLQRAQGAGVPQHSEEEKDRRAKAHLAGVPHAGAFEVPEIF